MVKDGAGSARTTYAVDTKIANLIFLEGLRVISRDVSVTRQKRTVSEDVLRQIMKELSKTHADNPSNNNIDEQ